MSDRPRRLWLALPLFGSLISPCFGTEATCTQVSASPSKIIFPLAQAGGGVQPAVTGTLAFTCATDGTDVVLGIGAGQNPTSTRNLASPSGQFIPYTITRGGTPWGNNDVNGSAVTVGPTTPSQTMTFTASVPNGIASGQYTDRVIVSANSAENILDLSIEIANSCSASVQSIHFGNLVSKESGSTVSSKNATLTISCTNTVAYHWGATGGANWSGTSRRMKHASLAQYMTYSLTEGGVALGDAGMPPEVGVTTPGIAYRSSVGTGAAQTFTVTAKITSATIPNYAGDYADVVRYTIAWE